MVCKMTNDMSHFYPGGASFSGFLAVGEVFEAVRDRDLKTLSDHKITCTQIADAMDTAVKRAQRSAELNPPLSGEQEMGGQTIFDGTVQLQDFAYCGSQGCPFVGCDKGIMSSHNYIFTNRKTKERIKGAQLSSHLIRDHQFFEGAVPYRVDPETIIRMLDLKPGVSYASAEHSTTESRWVPSEDKPSASGTLQALRSKATSEWRLSRRKIGLIFPGDQLLVVDTYGPSEPKLFNLNVNGYRLRAKIGSRQLFTLEKHTFVVDSAKDEKASLKGRRATVADAKDPWPERCIHRTKLYDDVVAAVQMAKRKARPRLGLAKMCEYGARLTGVEQQQYDSFIAEHATDAYTAFTKLTPVATDDD